MFLQSLIRILQPAAARPARTERRADIERRRFFELPLEYHDDYERQPSGGAPAPRRSTASREPVMRPRLLRQDALMSAGLVGLAACLGLASGCSLQRAAAVQTAVLDQAYNPHPKLAPIQPPMPESLPPAPQAAPTRGSIWSPDTEISWFTDDKSLRRGDTVLVKVVQKSTASKTADTSTQRDASISANIKYFLGLEKRINKTTGYKAAPGTWEPNNLLEATSSNKFTGTGSTDRSDELEATVSAVVTDVLRNGNLMIYGHQTVTLNNEASVLTVQGIIRPSDVARDNSIDSSRIANAYIAFNGSGVLTDKQHPGWAIRVFDWVWPF